MKARLIVPETIDKKYAQLVAKIMELNIDRQIMPISMEYYKNSEKDIVVHGSGFTVGYVPKEWMHLETDE